MVTGTRPFQGHNEISAALKRLSEAPIPPRKVQPELSPVWESVILRCLEREPEKRFASAAEVATALAGNRDSENLSQRRRFSGKVSDLRWLSPLSCYCSCW